MSPPEGVAADPDCLFCKIVSGEIPSDKVLETDSTLAFRDINPAAPSHVLVIPKSHVASVQELTDAHTEELSDVFAAIRAVATQEGISGGYRVVTNVGPEAGQSVFHLHFHVMGRRSLSWPPG